MPVQQAKQAKLEEISEAVMHNFTYLVNTKLIFGKGTIPNIILNLNYLTSREKLHHSYSSTKAYENRKTNNSWYMMVTTDLSAT